MKLSLAALNLVAMVALLAGCSPITAVHPTMHPSLRGNTNAAGIGVGALYVTDGPERDSGSSSLLNLPYGEGWARFATGTGQFEVRVTPGIGFGSYRINAMTVEEDGFGLAVIPSLGLGLWHFTETAFETTDSATQLALAPNVSLLFALGGGNIYLAPRLGLLSIIPLGDSTDDSSEQLSLAAAVGYTVEGDPFSYSFELGLQRVTPLDEISSTGMYVIAPTVGLQL